MSEERGESVFSRWSRRKLAVQEEQENQQEQIELAKLEAGSEGQLTESAAAVEAEPEAPPLTDADMPDIATLTEDSDFTPFMSPGVSDELRKLALRKLFQSSVFNVRDGLDEYDDDFTTFEKLGDIVTSDMKHQMEMQKKRQQEKLEAEQAVDDEMEDFDDAEDIEDEAEQQVAQADEAEISTDGTARTLSKTPEESTDEQS